MHSSRSTEAEVCVSLWLAYVVDVFARRSLVFLVLPLLLVFLPHMLFQDNSSDSPGNDGMALRYRAQALATAGISYDEADGCTGCTSMDNFHPGKSLRAMVFGGAVAGCTNMVEGPPRWPFECPLVFVPLTCSEPTASSPRREGRGKRRRGEKEWPKGRRLMAMAM